MIENTTESINTMRNSAKMTGSTCVGQIGGQTNKSKKRNKKKV